MCKEIRIDIFNHFLNCGSFFWEDLNWLFWKALNYKNNFFLHRICQDSSLHDLCNYVIFHYCRSQLLFDGLLYKTFSKKNACNIVQKVPRSYFSLAKTMENWYILLRFYAHKPTFFSCSLTETVYSRWENQRYK